MTFIKEAWYAIGWADDVVDTPLTRTILDMPIIVYRDEEGQPVAMLDRCPHRFAPLSRGTINGSTIQCGYHGLAFNSAGQCIRNPFSKTVPAAAKVRTFPIVEQDKTLWIWTGEASAADPSVIPRLPHHTDPDQRCIFGSTLAGANYRLIIDNLLDLTHVAFVHPGFGGGTYIPKVTVTENDRGDVQVRYLVENMPNPMPAEIPGQLADARDCITWIAPGTNILEGRRVSVDPPDHHWVNMSAHLVTPESATSSHYFWSSSLATDSPMTDEVHAAVLSNAFGNEDKPMLEAVQANMAGHDLFDLDPILLKTDSGGVRARRRINALIKAESQQDA